VWHVWGEEEACACRVTVEKREGKESLGRLVVKCEDNIKMEINWKGA
jgi:hypothetical protein